MERKNRKVHGSFDNSEETISAIRQLKEEGYTKEQIRVYTNAMNDKTFDKTDNDKDLNEDKTFDKTEDDVDLNEEKTFDKTEKDMNAKAKSSMDIVDDKETKADTADNDDESLWDKVKDFFTSDSYDYDKESGNPNYRKENDVLYPYRNDLASGNRVIVLDKANENQTRVNI